MSEPQPEPDNGISGLRGRRAARAERRPPPPRHPRPEPSTVADATVATAPPAAEPPAAAPVPQTAPAALPVTAPVAVTTSADDGVAAPVGTTVQQRKTAVKVAGTHPRTPSEVTREISREITQTPDRKVSARRLPDLAVDLEDPTALMVTPTVLSVPNTVLRRFEDARRQAPSHTGLVLDALRANAERLPDLVLALRPGPRPGDLFPYRATPGATSTDRPGPLRIRPTAGELAIMDKLAAWVNGEISHNRPGVRKVSRSEVVAVALDAFLPPA